MKCAAFALTLLVPAAAAAQTAPPAPIQDWSTVETITVVAPLDDLDTIAAHAIAAAHAWSIGDLAGLKTNYSEAKAYDCFNHTKTFADDRAKTVTATVNAVDESLTKPGRTVFVMELGIFLRKDGVLDRLAAQGIKVEGPPG